MIYRDDREALRARNEDLQRELDELRGKLAPRAPGRRRVVWRVARTGVPLLAAAGLITTAFAAHPAAGSEDPSPAASQYDVISAPVSPATSPSVRAPSPLLSSGKAKRRPSSTYHLGNNPVGAGPSPEHVYRGVVAHTSPDAPIAPGTSCAVRVGSRPRAGGSLFCAVNMQCGDRALVDGAYAKCTFDEHGFPHGGDLQKSPLRARRTEVRMEGKRLELISDRPNDTFALSLELELGGASSP